MKSCGILRNWAERLGGDKLGFHARMGFGGRYMILVGWICR